MAFFKDSKQLLSLAQTEGKIVKLRKLIQMDQESLQDTDGFLNRHAKINKRLERYYGKLEETEQALRDFINKK